MPTIIRIFFTLKSRLASFSSFICFSFISISSMMLFACSDETETANLSSNNTSTPTVLSPELNTLFIDSCALCHTNEKTGAPLAGDVETWNHILSKGMDETLDRAIQGFGGMPPNGQCFECTPEQLSQLIQYMSASSPSGVES